VPRAVEADGLRWLRPNALFGWNAARRPPADRAAGRAVVELPSYPAMHVLMQPLPFVLERVESTLRRAEKPCLATGTPARLRSDGTGG
jgi:hypothetical protein